MATRGFMGSGCSTWPLIGADVHPAKLHVSSASVFARNREFMAPVKHLVAASDAVQACRTLRIRGVKASLSTSSETDKLTKLEGIELYDPSGAPVSLVSLWKDRTAVVAFARHFGCVLCRKRVDLLESRKADMDTAGVALVLIAPGNPEQARAFLEQTKFSGEVYADPEHLSYDALEFVHGVFSVLNPKSGSHVVQAYREGYSNDWTLSFVGETMRRGAWQQGGIIVAGPGISTLRYLFKDARAGEEPNLDDVISACCSG